VFTTPLLATEPIGVQALSQLAKQTFGEDDPCRVMHHGPTQTITAMGEGSYLMRIPMPNVEASRLTLTKKGDELYVELGAFRRLFLLPATMAAMQPGTARIHNGDLEIPFNPP
jgi:arsenite-transporting ATPase